MRMLEERIEDQFEMKKLEKIHQLMPTQLRVEASPEQSKSTLFYCSIAAKHHRWQLRQTQTLFSEDSQRADGVKPNSITQQSADR